MKEFDGYFRSAHYVFHFHKGSFAEKEIEKIAAGQEICFQKISQFLGITFPGPLEYYLCDTALEVGDLYGDGEACNGFARMPNQIFAVYNQEVQCVGPHEDGHILSYQIHRPNCPFLREGLAMYFDQVWWGIPNRTWCAYFDQIGIFPSLEKLLEREFFFDTDCAVSYPVAGFFTQWFLEIYGKAQFFSLYRQDSHYCAHLEKLTGHSIWQLEEAFRTACRQSLSSEMTASIERLLNP